MKPVVMHVTTSHDANDVRILERECRSLAKSGAYRVVLVAPGAIRPGIEVQQLRIADPPASRNSRLFSGVFRAFSIAVRVRADLYHLHDPELIPLAIWLSLMGRQVIWDAHEDYELSFNRGSFPSPETAVLPRVGDALARGAIKRVLRAADRTVAGVVAATEGIAARYNPAHTVVVGNEALLEDFRNVRPEFESDTILFTGSPSDSHLFSQVVAAVHALPQFRLVLAGGPVRQDVVRRTHEKLGQRFDYVGFLNREQLAEQMAKSSVGMVTYAPEPAYMDESISPTKLFEFAAAGLPIVGSPVPGVHHFVSGTGSGVVARGFGWSDIRDALLMVASSGEAWQQFSDSGRAWMAANDPWSESEHGLLDLYRVLLSEWTDRG